MNARPPGSPLFPYTTLFRSRELHGEREHGDQRRDSELQRERNERRGRLEWRQSERERGVDGERDAELDGREHRSEEHTSELQSLTNLVCRLLLEEKNTANDQ